MPIEAVIFDLYGTLLVPVPGARFRSPFRALLASLGDLPRDQVETLRHLTITRPLPTLAEAAALLERETGRAVPREVVHAQEAALAGHVASFQARRNAHLLLGALRTRGIHLALLSNLATPYKAPARGLGLESWFDAAVYSCDVGLAKPDPATFHLTLARLGDVAPANALMVGDRQDLDAQGACDAGLRALRLAPDQALETVLRCLG